MALPKVRRFAVFGAAFALTTLLPSSTPLDAQYVQAPRATETYGPDRAQERDWNDDIPAHLSFVEGSVTLERDGRLEPAEANIALLAGDRLRTRGSGRVEIMFADGSALTVDEHSELDLLSDTLVRLLDGQMRLSITRATAALEYRVDAPAASVWIRAPGDYKVRVRNDRRPEVLLTVIRGSAELVNEFGRSLVRAGTEALATPDLAPSLPYAVNSASYDDFDRWTENLRDDRVGATSVRYLPTELRYYSGAFDDYGAWNYVAPHGYVWYPRVQSSWRPYSVGRWSMTAHFGWFWVGIDRWSWPTHHYGRWGYSSGGWYWIPDRRWGPAWVAWGGAPGYVSWCPVGFDGRPVIGFSTTYWDPWRAWTIVPARSFGHNLWVTQHVVVHTAIAPSIRSQFVERRSAPVITGYAVPRNGAEPLRAPTMARTSTAARTRTAPPAGEEWRQPRSSAQAARGDAASSPSRSAVPRDTGRPTVGTTDPSTRTEPDRGGAAARSRATAPADRGALPVDPDRSDRTEPSRSAAPRGGVPRVSVPEVNAPRVTSPRVDSPRIGEPDGRSRAVPRGQDPQVSEPPRAERPSAGDARGDRSAAPRTPPPAFEPRNDDRGRARAPSAEPSRPSAPPPAPEPDRARSRGGVERPAPSAPPPPQASQPARSRGGDGGSPPPPPPSAGSPPSRGGGDAGPRAVPRARGGGGGVH